MCRYCENIVTDSKMDGGFPHKDLMPCSVETNDYPEHDTMVAIIDPTPVSKRRHQDDGLVGLLNVYFSDEKARVANMFIPIRYCPICGRDLVYKPNKNKNTQKWNNT